MKMRRKYRVADRVGYAKIGPMDRRFWTMRAAMRHARRIQKLGFDVVFRRVD